MASYATRTAWPASGVMLRYLSTFQRTSRNAPVFLSVPSSTTTLTLRRSLFVLPFGIEVGLLGFGAYYFTRLKKPAISDVMNIFGPWPGSKESEANPEKVVRCIAHRGASLDAPENTLQAFRYCVERNCNFIELDIRSLKDGRLVVLHDQGLQRLTGENISDVNQVDWENIKDLDVGYSHPNRRNFQNVRLCLLDEALDFLQTNNVRVIIDVKGDDMKIVNSVVSTFAARPNLYQSAAVTCFNPFILYQIRKRDPRIVGAISYRPYCFSAQDYDAENGPTNPRFGDNPPLQVALRAADMLHGLCWRVTAKWCNVSAVFLHKDIISPAEVSYWKALGIRCCGWSVNRPLEKLYYRGVIQSPYLASTLLAEPDAVLVYDGKQRKTKEGVATCETDKVR